MSDTRPLWYWWRPAGGPTPDLQEILFMFTTFAVWFALAAAVYPLPIAGVVGVVATVGMVVVAFLASMVVTLIAFSAIGTAFVHLSGVER